MPITADRGQTGNAGMPFPKDMPGLPEGDPIRRTTMHCTDDDVVDACNQAVEDEKKEILEHLRDGQGELLTDDQLDDVETWEEDIDPRICKAEEYDGKTWTGLVELIRRRQAQKRAARQAMSKAEEEICAAAARQAQSK
jgi:hypothetical protein